MNEIFISYRRDDGPERAQLIAEHLKKSFGEDKVFLDTSRLNPGAHFPYELENAVKAAKLIIAMIGPSWRGIDKKKDRLREDGDWVSRELELALTNPHTKLFPVFVNAAESKESFENLPDSISRISDLNAIPLRNLEFERDILHLIAQITKDLDLENPLKDHPYKDGKYRLPAIPFKGLDFFTEKDVRIFFGRGIEIRRLINFLVNSEIQILLYFGYTGVGKSSLLFAGLKPRLENKGWKVFYFRREKNKNVFNEVLPNIQSEEGYQLVILDQLEEIFTDPRGNELSEVEKRALIDLVGKLNKNEHIKVLLSFRKEFLAEIKALLKGQLMEEEFLEPLSSKGILEAIEGLTLSTEYRDTYALSYEENGKGEKLSHLIGQTILGDSAGNKAPLLQLLLRKMWDKVPQKPRRITFELFEEVKSQNLKELVGEQLKSLGTKFQEESNSGLVLELLFYFTTVRGTSAQHPIEKLALEFQHPKLRQLLEGLKNLFLLIEIDSLETSINVFRLGHDSLAPIIREMHELSDLPGQKAIRLLNSKKREIEDGESVEFSKTDLKILEAGRMGMRAWSDLEEKVFKENLNRVGKEEKELEEKNKNLEEAKKELFETNLNLKKTLDESDTLLSKYFYQEGKIALKMKEITRGILLISNSILKSKNTNKKLKFHTILPYLKKEIVETIIHSKNLIIDIHTVLKRKEILIIDENNIIRIFNIEENTWKSQSLKFSNNSIGFKRTKYLLSDDFIFIWETNKNILEILNSKNLDKINTLDNVSKFENIVYSNKLKRLVLYSNEGNISVYNLETCKIIKKEKYNDNLINCSLINDSCLSLTLKNSLRIINIETLKEKDIYHFKETNPKDLLNKIQFNKLDPLYILNNNLYFFTKKNNILVNQNIVTGKVTIFDLKSSKIITQQIIHKTPIKGVEIINYDQKILIWDKEENVFTLDLNSGNLSKKIVVNSVNEGKIITNDSGTFGLITSHKSFLTTLLCFKKEYFIMSPIKIPCNFMDIFFSVDELTFFTLVGENKISCFEINNNNNTIKELPTVFNDSSDSSIFISKEKKIITKDKNKYRIFKVRAPFNQKINEILICRDVKRFYFNEFSKSINLFSLEGHLNSFNLNDNKMEFFPFHFSNESIEILFDEKNEYLIKRLAYGLSIYKISNGLKISEINFDSQIKEILIPTEIKLVRLHLKKLYILTNKNQILKYDFPNLKLIAAFNEEGLDIDEIFISDNHDKILICKKNRLKVLNLSDDTIQIIPVDRYHITPVFNSNLKIICYFDDEENELIFWNTDWNSIIWKFKFNHSINGLILSKKNNIVITWSKNGKIYIFDIDNKSLIKNISVNKYEIVDIKIISDMYILSIFKPNILKIWKIDGIELIQSMKIDNEEISKISYFDKDKLIFIYNQRHLIKIVSDETFNALDLDIKKSSIVFAYYNYRINLFFFINENGELSSLNYKIDLDEDVPSYLINLEAEVYSGTSLNLNTLEVEVMEPEEWKIKKAQYEEIAREHYKVCKHPKANWWASFNQEEAKKLRPEVD